MFQVQILIHAFLIHVVKTLSAMWRQEDQSVLVSLDTGETHSHTAEEENVKVFSCCQISYVM